MEDAVSDRSGELLPGGEPVRFSEIESALSAWRETGGGRGVTATVVAVGPAARLVPAAAAFAEIADVAGIRAILISNGAEAEPKVHVASYAVAIEGLLPRYVNNAVAAVRLPSLPMLVWWRGGAPGALDGLAELADRLVLDTEDPVRVWVRAAALAEHTALSDLRWTALTRWRTVLAHFFDIQAVRAATASFDTLQVDAGDRHGARLLAGWLASRLRWDRRVTIDLREAPGSAIQLVRLSGGGSELTLRLVADGRCIEAAVSCRDCSTASQIVPLGDQSLAGLLAEELRVRSRDLAFEEALRAMEDVA
jgi:glucose-6-phosphate dehydrogenase assembly protein OpcA